MGLELLETFLKRHRRIALDTSIFIYQVESNPRYSELTDQVFGWFETHSQTAITSTITMTELLVQPYRQSKDRLAGEYYGLLSTFPNLEWMAPTLQVADTAARLRAQHRLRTPDALQAATAIHGNASGFLTNDPIFQRIQTFETLLLDKLL